MRRDRDGPKEVRRMDCIKEYSVLEKVTRKKTRLTRRLGEMDQLRISRRLNEESLWKGLRGLILSKVYG